jgi:hypothetical protein
VKPEEFSAHAPGSLLDIAVPRGERAWAFVPDPLPPAIKHTDELIDQLARAMLALGKLGGLGANLPNPHLLIRPFVVRRSRPVELKARVLISGKWFSSKHPRIVKI